VNIVAVGHAHIDVAWLWTLGQTRRKAGRTFHNVLCLMEQFPEFRFSQSQPQLYDCVRQDYPALFESIQQRVREGRWKVLGGTWPDRASLREPAPPGQTDPHDWVPVGPGLAHQFTGGESRVSWL